MAFQLSPGVVVTEEDRSVVVPQVATTAGALAGSFQWGPVNEPTTVDTEGTLVANFGKPNDTTAGYFFTAANFLSYGNNLKIARVVDKGVARNAVSTPDGKITNLTLVSTPNTFTSSGTITVTIGAPGGSGTQATANAILANSGIVSLVTMINRGFGYNTAPVISFQGGGGTGAAATATLSLGQLSGLTITNAGNGYHSLSNVVIGTGSGTDARANISVEYKLRGLRIVNGGTNYGPVANIQFSGNIVAGGNHAQATPIVTGNVIVGYFITNNGNGYIGRPNVIINRNDGNTGTEASLTANIGMGYISNVIITSTGGLYTTPPLVTVNRNTPPAGFDLETENSGLSADAANTAILSPKIIAQIDGITITNFGSGYTSAPNVIITVNDDGVPSSNAIATATVGYTITGFNILNRGSGYTSTPTVTVIDTSNVTATATAVLDLTAPLIENTDDYLTNHSSGGYSYGVFASRYPGVLGNSLRVSIADANTFSTWQYANNFNATPGTSSYAAARNGSNDELHIVVVDADGNWTGQAGTVLEKFSFLSKASDAKNSDQSTNYYKDVIRNQSKYIWVIDHPTGTTNWGTTVASKTFNSLTANVTATLSGGASGDSVSLANIQSGYSLFENDELYDVSLIPMGPTTDVGVVNTVIGIAESRRDCIVFASPPYADIVNTTGQAAKVVTYRNSLTSSSFAVLDTGWKYQYDRYNDKYRYIPLNGDIAGLAARTDFVADPWFSPAGYNRGVIKNVVKLAYSPSKTDRDTLYKSGANPVVTFPGQGTVLFGDKTLLARPSAFDRINVRRLFIVLEKAISTASKFQLFEFNDPFTRAQFRNLVEPFLRDVQGRRGITDFRVICDESNNTAEIIDRNEFVADIYIKPARSINFIQLNFVATRSGVSFEEVGA